MDGLLLVDKPLNWTSFDVVAKTRGIIKSTGVKKPKVGHTGTLDPLATGLMILVLGSYCKRAAEFSKLDKTYKVTAILGKTSTTGDNEGQKTTVSSQKPTQEQVQAALAQFIGPIQQKPPQYSAIKVNGQRAYQLARDGKTVDLEPRSVTIHTITEVKYHYPELSFSVSVSSGTYVRSLVEDVGNALGVGAYTGLLRRTQVGSYDLDKALAVQNLSAVSIAQNLQTLA